MSTLGKETDYIQNSGIAAVLLWRAICGYTKSNENAPCPLQLLFLVLPILFHEETAEFVIHTNKSSGLQLFTQKFGSTKSCKNDLLLSINARALDMRRQSFEALQLGMLKRLVALRVDDGMVFPISTTTPKFNIPEAIKPLMSAADKLGFWFGQHTLFEIQELLKVRF